MTQHDLSKSAIKPVGAAMAAAALVFSAITFVGAMPQADAASPSHRVDGAVTQIAFSGTASRADAAGSMSAADCAQHAWPYIPAACLQNATAPVRVIGQ